MPMVTVTGNVRDHMNVAVPAGLQPELWFRPNGNNTFANNLFPFVEVQATLDAATGNFSVELFSDGIGEILYQPVLKWLTDPSQAAMKMEHRAFGTAEWPFWFYPGEGGGIGNLIGWQFGIGDVWAHPNAPSANNFYRLQLDTDTGWLYERYVTW